MFTTFAVIHSLIVCCLPTDLLPVFWISCRRLPAPDLLPGSLLRLACPATLSSLVLDPCLLTLINKLLQMDLTESDESQQKTSPDEGPATMSALSVAFSTQANQLAAHHHQLTRLTSLTEELIQAVRALQTSAPDPPPVPTQPPAARAPELQPSASASPRLALPEKFEGDPSKCKGFVLQCALYLAQQSTSHSTDTSKIAFICSLLTGRALDWITAV